jgi:hypothetical protein
VLSDHVVPARGMNILLQTSFGNDKFGIAMVWILFQNMVGNLLNIPSTDWTLGVDDYSSTHF